MTHDKENEVNPQMQSNGTGIGISPDLQWRPVPETLPPDPHGGWYSPTVWIALQDGRVVQGYCMHKRSDAQYDAPVQSWFRHENGVNSNLDADEVVVAWMPITAPNHPYTGGF